MMVGGKWAGGVQPSVQVGGVVLEVAQGGWYDVLGSS
jgi:hypothetical protein